VGEFSEFLDNDGAAAERKENIGSNKGKRQNYEKAD
jgi:hypothetical protein